MGCSPQWIRSISIVAALMRTLSVNSPLGIDPIRKWRDQNADTQNNLSINRAVAYKLNVDLMQR